MNETAFRVATLPGVDLLQCSALLDFGVPHGFTLRTGGFGARGNGEADLETLARALGLRRLASIHQVHGNEIRVLDERGDPSRAHLERCDGLLGDQSGVGLVVQSADCVPLLLWDSKKGVVAAVHAGWRGTLGRIASRAIERLREVKDTAPGDLVAVVGPAIRVCCFEVGDEVISSFAETGRDIDRISRSGPRGRRHLDLLEDNRAQLLACGVPPERIFDSGVCTRCDSERFYSFRGEGEGVGRIFGVIGVR